LEHRRYLVEAYFPRRSRGRLAEVAARIRDAAEETRGKGVDVRYLFPIFLPDDETCLHLFAGPSAEAVGEVSRRAGVEYDRIVEAVQ
jgi:hypothetical protein